MSQAYQTHHAKGSRAAVPNWEFWIEWAFMSLPGWLPALVLSFCASALLTVTIADAGIQPPTTTAAPIITGLVSVICGITVGLVQSRVLRRYLVQAGDWILATAAGIVYGAPAAVEGRRQGGFDTVLSVWLLCLVSAPLAAALITGPVLTRLLRQRPPQPQAGLGLR